MLYDRVMLIDEGKLQVKVADSTIIAVRPIHIYVYICVYVYVYIQSNNYCNCW